VIEKDYAEVVFHVEKDPGSAISNETYTIYRKTLSSSYQAVREVAASEIQNGAYIFLDRYLDRNVAYTYVIQARSSQGDILALSNEQTI
ncbi:MAG: hypothetical protein JXO51_05235, partial [Candidatus Aminicenantes bacterium]|nr:hypothetical protein [Candidatus Aminicenantes bacterium]